MKKFFAIFISVCFISIFVVAMVVGFLRSRTHAYIPYHLTELNTLTTINDYFKTPVFLLDDSVLFSSFFWDENNIITRVYYRYFFDLSEYVMIDIPYNFVVSTGRYHLIDNMLFYYVGVDDFGQQGVQVSLFGIDLEYNRLIRFTEGVHQTRPIIHFTAYNNKIASLKNRREGDFLVSYVEVFDARTQSVRTISEGIAHMSDMQYNFIETGIFYVNIASCSGLLYVLYDMKKQEDDHWLSGIRVYDEDMSFQKGISIDKDSGISEIMDGRVSTFEVFGNFFLCKIICLRAR